MVNNIWWEMDLAVMNCLGEANQSLLESGLVHVYTTCTYCTPQLSWCNIQVTMKSR